MYEWITCGKKFKNLWMFNKISYVNTGKVFQISLRSRRYSTQWRGWKFCWGKFVINSSLRLKFSIYILELSILSSKDLLFLIGLWFLWEKPIFHIYFTVLFYPGYILDFMTYYIWYTRHFFLLSQTNLIFWLFILGSKLDFLVDFIKNNKMQKGVKTC